MENGGGLWVRWNFDPTFCRTEEREKSAQRSQNFAAVISTSTLHQKVAVSSDSGMKQQAASRPTSSNQQQKAAINSNTHQWQTSVSSSK
jgi:hypothetical protein